MFGKSHHSATPAAEAWHELRDVATERAKDVGGEARRRAGVAWDVLAGRQLPNRKWPVIRAGLLGVAVGWGAAELYRWRRQEVNKAVTQLSNQLSGELREAKATVNERIAKAKATPGSPIEKAKAAVGRANATPAEKAEKLETRA